MLRAAIISPDPVLHENLYESLNRTGVVSTVRIFEYYPSELDLARFVRAHAPQVIFLSMESLDHALHTVQTLGAEFAEVDVVAIHRDCRPEGLVELLRAGVKDCLFLPFEQAETSAVINRVGQRQEQKTAPVTTGNIYSFLPSKPGAGASTVALNTAIALSRMENQHALLVDLDLNSGMLQFMLKLTQHDKSVKDAAEWALDMDETVWPRLVATVRKLDVLPAGPLAPEFRLAGTQVGYLAEFWRRMYSTICVDLSGDMELHSLEVMQESKQIFLVCTPEMPSLHLAKAKYTYLRMRDLGDRVKLIVNRQTKDMVFSTQQISELVGAPIHAVLSNEYSAVHKSLLDGKGLGPDTVLGKQVARSAVTLVHGEPVPAPAKQNKQGSVLPGLLGKFSPAFGRKPANAAATPSA
jgi:pilus assembly protein CpaE